MNMRTRIFLTGVGGQGTLTATTLLARVAVDQGIAVVAGEIHGMAQRGGVVESMIALGGWKSPKIDHGTADILLGFDLLETKRALPYLKAGGAVFSGLEVLPPPGVSLGREHLADEQTLKADVVAASAQACFVPIRRIGVELGAAQIGNAALLGAVCASGLLPFGFEALEEGIRRYLRASQVAINLQAACLGRDCVVSS